MNEKTSYLLDILGLKEKEFAIFCGAGISKNSGLPLANKLKQSILEKLPIDKKDIDEVMKSNLPFEAFMESLSENTDISKILDIFKDGEPNINHILIARLAKNGYLRTIFTTNFDLLIEKALVEKEGLKEDVDFKRYYKEEHFSEIDFDNLGDKIRIFKIHGSADSKDSIRTTLKAVASKTLSDKRMNIIRHLFSSGRHKKVLILGYSCSDTFDITPQIQSIEKSRKKIIFLEHSDNLEEIEDIKTKKFNNPFRKFPGKRIKCNTDNFIKNLWNSLREIVREYGVIKSTVEWKTYLDEWTKGLEGDKIYLKYFLTGLLLERISNFKKAIEFINQSFELTKKIGDEKAEQRCYSSLGDVYQHLGDFKKTIESHNKALSIAKNTVDKAAESGCYRGLGSAYYRLGDFRNTAEYYERSLKISKELGDKASASRSYANLGYVYTILGNGPKALVCFENSLVIKKDIGDKAGEARSYIGMGNYYHCLGDFKKAGECYKLSLNITKSIGNRAIESSSYMGLGSVYLNLGDNKNGLKYTEKALELFQEMGDRAAEAGCYINLGSAYHDMRNNKRRMEYFSKALCIKNEIGDKAGESKCYMGLGGTYDDLRDFKRAIEYYLKAEKIFKETGQVHYLKRPYDNLSVIHQKIGDNKNVEKYKIGRNKKIKAL
ncbi:MAG: hypothetical protein A2W75_08795 [Nitrospinae bacterium RIFCSPLOWO2_12_39_15]|nr:MAG: hypothetical protein A2W75_08795 [Nitrospinae bacterium RIFCSPLOWO2_12_39_15]